MSDTVLFDEIPPSGPDASGIPGLHHWVATIVGVLDSAFNLTTSEQYEVTRIVNKLLQTLNIPDRGAPITIPMQVVQEMHAGIYSDSLAAEDRPRNIRRVTQGDCVAPLEAWRNAFETMITSAYPDLEPTDRILLVKILNDLLAAIGVPNRAAVFFPDSVLAANRDIEDAVEFSAELPEFHTSPPQ